MAIIWQQQKKGVNYEVRSAGRTRRLYTDGVFHSQYNPNTPVTGSVWDLLLLPLFFHPIQSVKRVLVLGVGGGAVINQINHFLSPQQIVAVELNPVHLYVAKRFFSVEANNLELVQGDAIRWVEKYRGEKFDVIIDDLFGEVDGEPSRAVEANERWCQQLSRLVHADGTLVMNFDTPQARQQSYWWQQRKSSAVKQRWRNSYEFSTELYSNSVGVWTGQRCEKDRGHFIKNLSSFKALDQSRADCRLSFKRRKLVK